MKAIYVKITDEMLQDFLRKYEDAQPDETERFGTLLALDELERLRKVTRDIDLDRLTEICNAEREERCVVLPCKIGDTVYHLLRSGYIVMSTVSSIHEGYGVRGKAEQYIKLRSNNTGYISAKLDISAFGKTVFPTREAAEQAAKENNNG